MRDKIFVDQVKMVLINDEHFNYKASKGKLGGAICMCEKCKEARQQTETRGTLKEKEPHPATEFARQYLADHITNPALMAALSSCAVENNRLAEICCETLRRILNQEPVSDRYFLGLAWTVRDLLGQPPVKDRKGKKKMQVEKIVWKTATAQLPCFKCKAHRATHRVTIRLNDAGTISLSLCDECTAIPETELLAHFVK